MDTKEIVSRYLESNPDVFEIQVEYKDGSSADFELDESDTGVTREAAIASLLSTVNWDDVEEVEVEFENGDKDEIDLDPDDDDDDDDDNDDDDDDDDDDEETT